MPLFISGQSASSSMFAVHVCPIGPLDMGQTHIFMAGREAGARPPVSEPPSTQREPPQGDGSLLPSSCALPPTPKSSPCLSTTMQLMQAPYKHLTTTNSMLGPMHLISPLPVEASKTGELGNASPHHISWLLAGVSRMEASCTCLPRC